MTVSRVKEGSLLPFPKDIGIISAGDNQVAFVSKLQYKLGSSK